VNQQSAESIAVAALGFLAAETGRLERFLDLSGLEPRSIRAAAADPQFLAGVLDYIHTNEPLLTAFATSIDTDPTTVERARATLNGRTWERDVP
jgi:uncharacterized protein DUF3572